MCIFCSYVLVGVSHNQLEPRLYMQFVCDCLGWFRPYRGVFILRIRFTWGRSGEGQKKHDETSLFPSTGQPFCSTDV